VQERQTQPEPKQSYEKPEVRRVKLVSGEIASAGCKTVSSMTGPTTGCNAGMCLSMGS
jgi:hypothetical protein